jgi:hypothetical protein
MTTRMTKAEKEAQVESARRYLVGVLGDMPAKVNAARPCVYTLVRQRGATNDGVPTARISCFVVAQGQLLNITAVTAHLLGRRLHPNSGGVACAGGGSDLAFDLVHALSYALHGLNGSFKGNKHDADHPFECVRQGYTLRHEAL